eukprot:1376616-Karenia_brevis.AAC.1
MLRLVLGSRRRLLKASESDTSSSSDITGSESQSECELESWAAWLQRTAHQIDVELEAINLDRWATAARKRKWACACRVAFEMQTAMSKWSHVLLNWQPNARSNACRSQGRPVLRWEDHLTEFLEFAYDQ